MVARLRAAAVLRLCGLIDSSGIGPSCMSGNDRSYIIDLLKYLFSIEIPKHILRRFALTMFSIFGYIIALIQAVNSEAQVNSVPFIKLINVLKFIYLVFVKTVVQEDSNGAERPISRPMLPGKARIFPSNPCSKGRNSPRHPFKRENQGHSRE